MDKKSRARNRSKKPAAKARAAKPANEPVNVMTDRRGTVFDPKVHAATADGTPHADSAGNYIRKENHYDGAKKAHFADSFRHAIILLGLLLLGAGAAWAQSSHTATLNWTLSVDDVTASCSAAGACSQNVYRAPGACSSSSAFTLLSSPSATATSYVDATVTPGTWCYGVTFVENGDESVKDTVTVTLQPAPPTGVAGTPK